MVFKNKQPCISGWCICRTNIPCFYSHLKQIRICCTCVITKNPHILRHFQIRYLDIWHMSHIWIPNHHKGGDTFSHKD